MSALLAVLVGVVLASSNHAAAVRDAPRVPAGARSLLITTTKFGRVIQGPITVRSSSKVRRVVALLNALPAFPPGPFACPADFGVRIRLALERRAGAAPVAAAVVDPTGCGEVQLTVRGRRQRPLAGGFTLTRQLDGVLGLKLETGVA